MAELENVDLISLPPKEVRSPRHGMLIVIAIWFVIVVLGHLRYSPPLPKSIDAPEDQFSAWRASQILQSLVGDGIPHPAGSRQNDVVRERIVAMLESWGYEPVIQATESQPLNNRAQGKVPLENIMVRLPGTSSTGAIMLASHYDSVPTAPGASDDGIGVAATLEIARMYAGTQPKNDVVFLITDGEEFGMLGARRWMEEHPWVPDVSVVINLEARGTDGPSLMFQTSEDSLWLIRILSRVVERPMTSSLFYEIYKRLPNDTDFTEFVAGGIEGFNFAVIGDVKNYHTMNDNVDNVNRGCLQHHGDNALALMNELVETDLRRQPRGRAVYFDLFGWLTVWWPERWSLWFSLLATVLLASLAVLDAAVTWRRFFSGMGMVLATMVLLMITGFLIGSGFSFDPRFEDPFPAQPVAIELSYWFASLVTLVAVVPVLPTISRPKNALISVLVIWTIAALVASFGLSGASYLFLVPVLVGVIGAIFLVPRDQTFWAAAVFAVAGGAVWLPLERLFYDAIGLPSPLLLGGRIAVTLSLLIPLVALSRTRSRMTVLGLGVIGFIIAVLVAIFANPVT